MSYEIKVGLIIENPVSGILDFRQAKHALGIDSPMRTWRLGDRLDTRSKRVRASDGLWYGFFEGRDCDPIEQASRLLDELEARGDAARSVLRNNSTELAITVRLYGHDTPPFNLTPQFIDRLQSFGLQLDLDLYVFCDDTDKSRVLPDRDQ